jgi:hypothetical protein
MTRVLAVAVLVAATAACVLCGRPEGRAKGRDYYPLGVGSRWRYQVYYLDSTGQEQAGTTRQQNEVRVAGRATLASGEEAAMVVRRMDQPYETYETSYVRNTGASVVSQLKLDSKLCDTVLVLPPAAGRAWRRLAGGLPRIAVSFVAQETVRVRAGTYFAWRADEALDSSTLRSSVWYAPGVGMVKTEVELKNGVRLIVELGTASIR